MVFLPWCQIPDGQNCKFSGCLEHSHSGNSGIRVNRRINCRVGSVRIINFGFVRIIRRIANDQILLRICAVSFSVSKVSLPVSTAGVVISFLETTTSHFPKVIYRRIPRDILSSRCLTTVSSRGSNAVSSILAGDAVIEIVCASDSSGYKSMGKVNNHSTWFLCIYTKVIRLGIFLLTNAPDWRIIYLDTRRVWKTKIGGKKPC